MITSGYTEGISSLVFNLALEDKAKMSVSSGSFSDWMYSSTIYSNELVS